MHAHFSFTKHVVCFRLLAKKAALKECIRRSQWNGKLEEKKKSKCVFLDFTEITSHHHKYACRKKVRGWNVVCIVSLGFLFLLPSNENNPYKYHIQINRRERISSSNPPYCNGKNSCCNKKKLMAIINLLLHFEWQVKVVSIIRVRITSIQVEPRLSPNPRRRHWMFRLFYVNFLLKTFMCE